MVESYTYDVFGEPTVFDGAGIPQAASSVGNRFLYTGREWIAEAGVYDYRNRHYSPQLGHFLQTDPIRFHAGDVNLYRYVGNSPGDYIDPTGEFLVAAAAVVAVAALAVGTYVAINEMNEMFERNEEQRNREEEAWRDGTDDPVGLADDRGDTAKANVGSTCKIAKSMPGTMPQGPPSVPTSKTDVVSDAMNLGIGQLAK